MISARRTRSLVTMTCAVLCVAFVGPVAAAQTGTAATRGETLSRFDRPISVTLDDTPLEDVFTFVEQVGQIDLDVKWLDDGGISGLERDRLITLSVEGIPLISFIERVLDRASDDEFDAATWQLGEFGELEIGPRSRLNRGAYLRVYDINDLIFQIPSFTEVPTLDLDSVLNQSQGGGGGSIFQNEETEGERQSRDELIEQLLDIITTSIEPDQWVDNGGDAARIREYNGTLLVTAPDYMHRQLGGYADFAPRRGARSGEARDWSRAYNERRQRIEESRRRRAAERIIEGGNNR